MQASYSIEHNSSAWKTKQNDPKLDLREFSQPQIKSISNDTRTREKDNYGKPTTFQNPLCNSQDDKKSN